ncbi:MAG: hypothetical protein EBT51_11855 [Flavobacteriaceae bacterium]|nr:hypothetical protein [Flavobacteriaceae bacterium]
MNDSLPPPQSTNLDQLITLIGDEKADVLRAESLQRGISLERLVAEIISATTDQVLAAAGVQEQVREEIIT